MKQIKPLVIGDLTVKYPVIQGGMGVGISLSSLAGAVAKEGGVGIISTAQIGYQEDGFEKNPLAANLNAIEKEFKAAKRIAPKGVIGFNIMVATKSYGDYVKRAVEAGADIIISGAGLPVDLPKFTGAKPVKLAPIVSTEKSARVICRYWDKHYQRVPDLIVIEGPEAGGHLGFSPDYLSQVTKEKYDQEIQKIIAVAREYGEKYKRYISVALAGGIFNRKDVDRALELGADGVQMATRFVTTYECDAPMVYKQTYLNAKEEDIMIVKSPVGMPGRAIRNKFLERASLENQEIKKCYQCLAKCNMKDIPYCISGALMNSVKGFVDDGLLFCGSNAWRCERMEHVADIFKELFVSC